MNINIVDLYNILERPWTDPLKHRGPDHFTDPAMTDRTAVDALKAIGLPTYEAEVFVALQELGTGTAAAVSDRSAVPRSQVYGAAEDLAARGLLEIVESSPKRYRPVSVEAAREQLARRQERERERAFDAIEDLAASRDPEEAEQEVSTLRGKAPVADRVTELIEGGQDEIVLVAPGAPQLSAGIEAALRGRAEAGVQVVVLTADADVAARFGDTAVRVVFMEDDAPADYTGRTLLVDDEAVLLSVVTPGGGGADEEAMWTAGTDIARILAEFVHTGMEAGMEPRDTARDANASEPDDAAPDGRD